MNQITRLEDFARSLESELDPFLDGDVYDDDIALRFGQTKIEFSHDSDDDGMTEELTNEEFRIKLDLHGSEESVLGMGDINDEVPTSRTVSCTAMGPTSVHITTNSNSTGNGVDDFLKSLRQCDADADSQLSSSPTYGGEVLRPDQFFLSALSVKLSGSEMLGTSGDILLLSPISKKHGRPAPQKTDMTMVIILPPYDSSCVISIVKCPQESLKRNWDLEEDLQSGLEGIRRVESKKLVLPATIRDGGSPGFVARGEQHGLSPQSPVKEMRVETLKTPQRKDTSQRKAWDLSMDMNDFGGSHSNSPADQERLAQWRHSWETIVTFTIESQEVLKVAYIGKAGHDGDENDGIYEQEQQLLRRRDCIADSGNDDEVTNHRYDERIAGDFTHWHSGTRLSLEGLREAYHGLFPTALNSGSFFCVHVVECVLRPDVELCQVVAAALRACQHMRPALSCSFAQRSHIIAMPSHLAATQWSEEAEWDVMDLQVGKRSSKSNASSSLLTE